MRALVALKHTNQNWILNELYSQLVSVPRRCLFVHFHLNDLDDDDHDHDHHHQWPADTTRGKTKRS